MPIPDPGNPSDELLTSEEVAEAYSVSVRTVTRWIKTGILPARKFGYYFRVNRSTLRGFDPGEHTPEKKTVRKVLARAAGNR